MANKVPMAGHLVWPNVVRPRIALVYLDLNHYINLAKATNGRAPSGYERLLNAATKAFEEQRALFPLSAQHLYEILAIKDPAQRSRIADVMEALGGFHYLLGRPEIAQLEIEAGIEAVLDESPSTPPIPLIGNSFGWAFGMVGGMKVVDDTGADAAAARLEMGDEKYEEFLRYANRTVERAMLDGPADDQIAELRANGYAPETARESHQSRLAFELDLSQRLQDDPTWRKGRLRDVVSAREIHHEWRDTFNRVQDLRTEDGRTPFNPSDDAIRKFMAALPHVQVAISLKTTYHRNPHHRWTTNDLTDIDAMSVAFTYCDAAFTDKAIRAALASSPELRQIPTYLPRTPADLADWLDALPRLPVPDFLIPASRHPTQLD